MGDDDFFHSKNLEELLLWFKNTEIKADIIQFPCLVGNDLIEYRIWGDKIVNYESLRLNNMLSFSCFYRKSLWEKVNGYDNYLFNDWLFWLKVVKAGASIQWWGEPIYYFRQAVEERLSDKERRLQSIEITREQLLKRL
jgi:hypothetical protein